MTRGVRFCCGKCGRALELFDEECCGQPEQIGDEIRMDRIVMVPQAAPYFEVKIKTSKG